MADIRRSRLIERMESDLAALRSNDQFREMTIPEGIPLCSNDYLGLSTHPSLRNVIRNAVVEDTRLSSTGSRLISGNSEGWERLERQFAEFMNVEAALYFPSGYGANIGLLSSVLKASDTVFSDSANHASLIDGMRLSGARRIIFPHLDMNYLEDALRRNTGAGEKVIVVEGIFSMDGDRAPVKDLIGLANQYGAQLVVDEAHSLGIEGEKGRGVVDAIGRDGCVLATVHTCGKALASMGAFVAGSRTLRDFLVNHARTFIYTTALPPYCAAHVSQAVALGEAADNERSHLKDLGRYLRNRIAEAGMDCGPSDSQIIPIVLGANAAALSFAAALSAAGFAVRAIRPPTVPPGTSRVRLSLNAGLSFADMDALLEAIMRARPSNE